jgi:hypothetical protein
MTQYLREVFRGTWALQREIINHLYPDLSGTVIGNAQFLLSDKPCELNYYESGNNQQNNGSILKVYYASIYHFDSAFKITNLSYSRTKLFEFNLHEQRKNYFISRPSIHHCKDDIYTAVLELLKLTKFQLNINVKGPNKDYTTSTVFRRHLEMIGIEPYNLV